MRRTAVCAVGVLLMAALVFLMSERAKPAPERARAVQTIAPTLTSTSLLPRFQASHGELVRIAATSDGFTTIMPEKKAAPSRWHNPARPVVAIFPRDFTNPVSVRSGSADVAARPLNAQSSTGRIEADGTLCYPGAFEHCDVLYRSSEFKTEEFIVVRVSGGADESARLWSWELQTNGLTPRLTPAHTIELCDAAGVPRLRINAPEGVDANRKPLRAGKELTLSLARDVVTLRADLRGCEYPVVIDPTFSSTGTMAEARHAHGAAMLQNGKVLVCGGNSAAPTVLSSSELYDPVSETWSTTGSMAKVRQSFVIHRHTDGRVLVIGGGSINGMSYTVLADAEIYDPATGQWSDAAPMSAPRTNTTATALADGRVLVVGGNDSNVSLASTEIYSFANNTWSPGPALANSANGRESHGAIRLNDGRVLVAGGVYVGIQARYRSCEILDAAITQWTAAGDFNETKGRLNMGLTLLPDGSVLSIAGESYNLPPDLYIQVPQSNCEILNPQTLLWSNADSMAMPHFGHFVTKFPNDSIFAFGGGNDTAELFSTSTQQWATVGNAGLDRARAGSCLLSDNTTVLIGGGISGATTPQASCVLFKSNLPPALTVDASPTVIVEGGSVNFSVDAVDAENDAFTLAWDFGDGSSSTDATVSHTYVAAGVYTAKITATDQFGAKSSQSITINVFGAAARPTARFTTSDVVAFVGQPFTFDASLSTDKQNNIVAYSWNFGDGSPAGIGQVISKIYEAAGTVTVQLTVTDLDGLSGTLSRQIEVLPAEQFGKFNSALEYKVKWNRDKENTDSLTLEAVVNVGADTQIAAGAALALEIAGSRFEGTLDAKFRDYTNKDEKWQVKAGTRKQQAGEVALKLTLKKANLGSGFNQAGAVAGTNPKDPVEVNIPVKLEIAGRTFELLVESSFKFNKDGKKASGEGAE